VLDVFETEPLPTDSRFWSHPRVSVNGHASGITGGQHHRNQALFLDNLARFAAGQPLLNQAKAADVLGG
jgi:phosphoglycerate dehydrogenase-like enzyme